VVVDVGANTGLYSLFASRYAAVVHAVEPYPPVLSRLRGVLEENQVSNVVVHPVGLGEAEESLPFYAPPGDNLGTGSFLQEFQSRARTPAGYLRIVSGDAYFESAGIDRIDVIKMDIEGYERPAVRGMRRILERHRPVLLLEVSTDPAIPELFRSLADFEAAVPEQYDFLSFANRNLGSGAYRLVPMRLSFEHASRANVVAVPAERRHLIPEAFDGDPIATIPLNPLVRRHF
jgi:FkbM family methyltransferase